MIGFFGPINMPSGTCCLEPIFVWLRLWLSSLRRPRGRFHASRARRGEASASGGCTGLGLSSREAPRRDYSPRRAIFVPSENNQLAARKTLASAERKDLGVIVKPPATKISKALARNLLNTIQSIDKAKKSRSGAPLAAKSTQSYCRSTPQCSTRREFYSNKALRAGRTLQQRETQHEFDKLDG